MPFEPIQSPRIYQQIAGRIADMIHDGDLKPGDRLPNEHELARRFGVSRGPVREAMIALETGGMIEVRHGNGAYVREEAAHRTDIDWNRGAGGDPGLVDQFEMREILLPEAAAKAATNISEEQIVELEAMLARMRARYRAEGSHYVARQFAVLIATASGNAMIQSVIEELMRLHGESMWTTLRARSVFPEQRRAAIECREKIVAALRDRDPKAARAATQDYLRLTRRIYFGDLAGPAGEEA